MKRYKDDEQHQGEQITALNTKARGALLLSPSAQLDVLLALSFKLFPRSKYCFLSQERAEPLGWVIQLEHCPVHRACRLRTAQGTRRKHTECINT